MPTILPVMERGLSVQSHGGHVAGDAMPETAHLRQDEKIVVNSFWKNNERWLHGEMELANWPFSREARVLSTGAQTFG
jgi:hypothetical protein